MQSSFPPSRSGSAAHVPVRVLWLILAVLLALPVAGWAGRTQASVSSAGRLRHVRAAAHSRRRGVRRRTLQSHSARVRRAHATRRRARIRRNRLDAALDNLHAAPAPAPSPETVATAPGPEAISAAEPQAPPQGSSLIGAAPDAVAAIPGGRNLAFPPTAVPRFMPLALRGSHEVLVHQNIIADVEGLSRIENDAQLGSMVHSGELVALPGSPALAIDSRLPLNRRYCRPWTAKFLADLSHAHSELFGQPLQLTSAVRTVDFQRHLARYNHNAAPAVGDTASPHLTGQAIDLGKKGMSQHEIAWMRAILGQLQAAGKLDVEEEFQQACFHISVYKTYAPASSRLPAPLIADATPADATPAEAPAEATATEATPASETASTPIGALSHPVMEPVAARHTWTRHRSYYVRHAAAHRRRYHHRRSMSLLAVRMR